jgi:tetratricopeptide (TPR) repeat protein
MNLRTLCGALLVLALIPAAIGATDDMQSAGALYSKSVDLANRGSYKEALAAADQALALNVTSLTGLIQSNRAGILVMLHRNEEAITAADAALAVEGDLTTVHAVAWYNKGNALRALGRIPEAREAYTKAYALDKTLVPPDMILDVSSTGERTPASTAVPTAVGTKSTLPVTPTPRSSPALVPVLASLAAFFCFCAARKKQ